MKRTWIEIKNEYYADVEFSGIYWEKFSRIAMQI